MIVQRWQELTGGEAILEATGETFADVEARRARGGGVDPPQSTPRDQDHDTQSQGGRNERE